MEMIDMEFGKMFKVIGNVGNCHSFDEGDIVRFIGKNIHDKDWLMCKRDSDGEVQAMIIEELEELV
jgi:hypothetical protein